MARLKSEEVEGKAVQTVTAIIVDGEDLETLANTMEDKAKEQPPLLLQFLTGMLAMSETPTVCC